ncbi:MAG: hypothetical protein KF687_11240 [Cyclobacteriaceae bacterium]|nr:hypothetical protein [Cyclobacteriaceae bacterium]
MTSCWHTERLNSRVIGVWTMEKVYEYGNDETEKHNPNKDRWIEFRSDGSFVSDGEPFGRNTGHWTTDNNKSTLIIDSDIDDDDSEWKVTFEMDQMTWAGIGHPRKENTRVIHKRKK